MYDKLTINYKLNEPNATPFLGLNQNPSIGIKLKILG